MQLNDNFDNHLQRLTHLLSTVQSIKGVQLDSVFVNGRYFHVQSLGGSNAHSIQYDKATEDIDHKKLNAFEAKEEWGNWAKGIIQGNWRKQQSHLERIQKEMQEVLDLIKKDAEHVNTANLNYMYKIVTDLRTALDNATPSLAGLAEEFAKNAGWNTARSRPEEFQRFIHDFRITALKTIKAAQDKIQSKLPAPAILPVANGGVLPPPSGDNGGNPPALQPPGNNGGPLPPSMEVNNRGNPPVPPPPPGGKAPAISAEELRARREAEAARRKELERQEKIAALKRFQEEAAANIRKYQEESAQCIAQKALKVEERKSMATAQRGLSEHLKAKGYKDYKHAADQVKSLGNNVQIKKDELSKLREQISYLKSLIQDNNSPEVEIKVGPTFKRVTRQVVAAKIEEAKGVEIQFERSIKQTLGELEAKQNELERIKKCEIRVEANGSAVIIEGYDLLEAKHKELDNALRPLEPAINALNLRIRQNEARIRDLETRLEHAAKALAEDPSGANIDLSSNGNVGQERRPAIDGAAIIGAANGGLNRVVVPADDFNINEVVIPKVLPEPPQE